MRAAYALVGVAQGPEHAVSGSLHGPRRALSQWAPPSSSISATTATAIGVVFGGVLLIIAVCYCFSILRRRRIRRGAAAAQARYEEEQQRRQEARAERRRRRQLALRGVPLEVVQQFPTSEYVRPMSKEPRMERSMRQQMMDAATSALTKADHASSDDESEVLTLAAAAAGAGAGAGMGAGPGGGADAEGASAAVTQPMGQAQPLSMLDKIRGAINSRSGRYNSHSGAAGGQAATATQGPDQVAAEDPAVFQRGQGQGAVAAAASQVSGAPMPLPSAHSGSAVDAAAWPGQLADLPQQSLDAARRASCAACSSLGRQPPSLRLGSSRKGSTERRRSGGEVGPQALTSSLVKPQFGLAAVAAAAAAAAAEEEEQQCAICLCDYESGDVLRKLPCGHDFHRDCVDSWMRKHTTCPLCRHVLFVHPDHPPEAGQPGAVAAVQVLSGGHGVHGVAVVQAPPGVHGAHGAHGVHGVHGMEATHAAAPQLSSRHSHRHSQHQHHHHNN